MLSKTEKELPGTQRGILLSRFTTYKIGGPAEYFFSAKKNKDVLFAAEAAKNLRLPFFVMGGGSNLLIPDKGIKGLVIHMKNSAFKAKEPSQIYAEAGAGLNKIAHFAASQGLSGLEWAVGIPGITLGGAIYGHAQAFGNKISDIVKNVEALDIKTLKIKSFSRKQCRFSVKNSIFKKNKNLIILSAVLEFGQKAPEEIKKRISENLSYRKNRHPLDFPSAGSVFVNPEVKIKNKSLLMKFPELNEYNQKESIPAGYLIAKCGLAGTRAGNAQISEKHANFIINLGGAKSKDVLKLIILAQKEVKKTFGIKLEPEVQLAGF